MKIFLIDIINEQNECCCYFIMIIIKICDRVSVKIIYFYKKYEDINIFNYLG